jgi:hypothetical protein
MLYRRLTIAELETLTPQFIHFLAANGIAGDDWERIKTENRSRMEAFLDDFSDLVFQTTIEKTNYLLHTDAQELMVFDMQEDHSLMYSFRLEAEAKFSFFDFKNLSEAIAAMEKSTQIQTFDLKRAYRLPRDREIFILLESGCSILQKTDFELLIYFYKNKMGK